MLHEFILEHRPEIIARAGQRVQQRLGAEALPTQLAHGVPVFLTELVEALGAGQAASRLGSSDNSDAGDSGVRSAINASAALHGRELLQNGFTIDQVVHGYGDVCQIVTELAAEQGASISVPEFHFFNQCLDGAIAGAVDAFGEQRGRELVYDGTERIGALAHELRNLLNTAVLSFEAITTGKVAPHGNTAAIHLRSLAGLRSLADRALAEVRLEANQAKLERLRLADCIGEVQMDAALEAEVHGIQFTVEPVQRELEIEVDRQLLASALANLLQNAFKYSRSRGKVVLSTRSSDDRVLIEVQDDCAGLSPEKAAAIFKPFARGDSKLPGLGLGLAIAQRAVELNRGSLTVRNHTDHGCVFTIDLPRANSSTESGQIELS